MKHPSVSLANLLVVSLALSGTVVAAEPPDFQRDVRPILADRCFTCHGFDEQSRQAGLRLDRFDSATTEADSGEIAIVPFQPEASELLRRITSDDESLRMPPEETGKTLSQAEAEMLRQWIAAGAQYAEHWSFQPPSSSPLPEVRNHDGPRNFTDLFVLQRLEAEGIAPQPIAEPERLLRRLSLDLTGLPPTLDELDHFLQACEHNPHWAYEAEVDRLLSSPHLGERLALGWLDAARFADTNGYFGDKPRQAWPWRDWVIRALNANMPFDQFTIEQLAGDLLPGATREQLIATGFHRNSMANNETGIIDEEYRVEAVADRLETTGTVWLGMTIGCAHCHDHKFDPLSQREYYQLFAFFNQSVETGLVTKDDPPPTIDVPTPELEAALQHAREELQQAESDYQAHSVNLEKDLADWETRAASELVALPSSGLVQYNFDHLPSEVDSDGSSETVEISDPPSAGDQPPLAFNRNKLNAAGGDQQIAGTSLQVERGIRGQAGRFDATQHVELSSAFNADQPWTISVWARPSSSLGCLFSKIEPTERRRGLELIWQKGRLQLNLVHRWGADEIVANTRDAVSASDWHHILLEYDGTKQAAGLRIIVDGRVMPLVIQRDTLSGSIRSDEPLRLGRRDAGLGYYGLLDEFRILTSKIPGELAAGWSDSERLQGVLARPLEERTAADHSILREYFIERVADRDLREAYTRRQAASAAVQGASRAIPTALVMRELSTPRPTHVLGRGEYDELGEEVMPGVPKIFPGLSGEGPPNRLTLTRWLVSGEHPLTARVAVNRLWQVFFGEGLVRTPGDFGAQGDLPTHPELLDELAFRFVRHGWDVKHILRFMVTSATYRQSSQASENLLELDPDNRLLARGPRFRLPAELVRDQALAATGLLAARIGGPSVRPPQPDGLWEEVSYNAEDSYLPDRGEGRWRRSLYTYWKRQAPPPAMLMFDANTREKCVVQRSRTNTPLQALVLLNDVTYVEAAQALAAMTLTKLEGVSDQDQDRLRTMFRRVVSRRPEPSEFEVLMELLQRQRTAFAVNPDAARQLLGASLAGVSVVVSGEQQRSRGAAVYSASELAAWTLVAQTILNLDEAITRR